MHEKLISGYATYASPAEFGGNTGGEAPASTPATAVVTIISLTAATFC